MERPIPTVRTARRTTRRRGTTVKTKPKGHQLSVAGVLHAYPGSSPEQIHHRTGLASHRVTKCLHELQVMGLVFTVADGGFYYEVDQADVHIHGLHYNREARGYTLGEFYAIFESTPTDHVTRLSER